MPDHTDIEHVMRHWLDDGPSTMPDRVVRVVAERIALEHQRPARHLSRRQRAMNPALRIIAAIAAVIAIAIVGWTVLPIGSSEIGGPPTSAPPAPTDAPSLTVTAAPGAYRWPASLLAGTYTTSLAWDVPFTLRFTVPEGWSGYDVEVSRTGRPGLSVEFALVDNVFADPCAATLREPPPGASVDALAEALSRVPGLDVTGPTPVEFDRVTRGQQLDYTVRDDAGCSPLTFALWDLSTDRFLPGKPNGGDRPKNAVADEGRIWILDVDGERLVIRATWDAGTARDTRAELEAIVDSIAILRPGASPPPQPAP